jgi:hypothetical protein
MDLIPLTAEQQALVEEVAAEIYRPCCNNSTLFPDCNHGMAMLGFLELLACGPKERRSKTPAPSITSWGSIMWDSLPYI